MKRICRYLGVFLCFILISALVLPINVFAAQNSVIDTSAADNGYFTVHYTSGSAVKMKVGVTFDNSTKYYDYTHGDKASYAFTEGNGSYTITLYQNVRGTSYSAVESKTVNVSLKDVFAPYLASTAEISFSKDDSVGTTAAKLCKDLKDNSAKVVAIHNYISMNFSYDNNFAAQVSSGAIKNYIPDTNKILKNQTGVCYDFSALFAAMCRSQEIPCKIQKGYLNGAYHAWNLVYIDDTWQSVDMTVSVSKSAYAENFSECLINAADGNTYSY